MILFESSRILKCYVIYLLYFLLHGFSISKPQEGWLSLPVRGPRVCGWVESFGDLGPFLTPGWAHPHWSLSVLSGYSDCPGSADLGLENSLLSPEGSLANTKLGFFLKGTIIPRKLMVKQKIKENPWIIAAVGLAGSATKVWPQWAPCSRAVRELGPGRSVYFSALFVARYPFCSEWLSCAAASPCRGAVAGSDYSWPQFLPSWSSTYPQVPDGNSRNTEIKGRSGDRGGEAGCKVSTRVFPNSERGLGTPIPKLGQLGLRLASLPGTETAWLGN